MLVKTALKKYSDTVYCSNPPPATKLTKFSHDLIIKTANFR